MSLDIRCFRADNLFNNEYPDSLAVVIVEATDYAGDKAKSPFYFENISSYLINFTINDQSINGRPLEWDDTNNNFRELFYYLFSYTKRS